MGEMTHTSTQSVTFSIVLIDLSLARCRALSTTEGRAHRKEEPTGRKNPTSSEICINTYDAEVVTSHFE